MKKDEFNQLFAITLQFREEACFCFQDLMEEETNFFNSSNSNLNVVRSFSKASIRFRASCSCTSKSGLSLLFWATFTFAFDCLTNIDFLGTSTFAFDLGNTFKNPQKCEQKSQSNEATYWSSIQSMQFLHNSKEGIGRSLDQILQSGS